MLGLFKRRRKTAWVKAVFAEPLPDVDSVSEDRLYRSTQRILEERRQIIKDSVRIIQQTRNEDTRRGRIELCRKHYEKVEKLKPFADRKQREIVSDCEQLLKEVGLL